MIKPSKLTQVLGSLVMLAMGIVFLLAASLGTWGRQSLPPETPAWIMPVVGAFLALFIDLAWYVCRQSFAIRESRLTGAPGGVWKTIAAVPRTVDLVGMSVMGLLVLAAAFFLLWVGWPFRGDAREGLTPPFINLQLGVASYIVLRWVVVRLFVRLELGSLFTRHLPTYELDDDGISIDLRWGSFQRGRCFKVHLRFEEIDEWRDMTFREAEAIMQGEVGPNVALAGQGVVDMYRYAAGKIPRPDVYIAYQSGGTTLFLRGPKVFYLITVGNTDNERLFAALAQKRSQKSDARKAPEARPGSY